MSPKEAICGNCGALVTGDFCSACASPVGSSIARTHESDSVELTDIERDILLAAQLADHLRAGGEPAEKAVGIRLDPGEVLEHVMQAHLGDAALGVGQGEQVVELISDTVFLHGVLRKWEIDVQIPIEVPLTATQV